MGRRAPTSKLRAAERYLAGIRRLRAERHDRVIQARWQLLSGVLHGRQSKKPQLLSESRQLAFGIALKYNIGLVDG